MAKLWTQGDKFGNDIYLTAERWQHIIDSDNHPEVEPFFDYLRQTIKFGRRRQDRYTLIVINIIEPILICRLTTLIWLFVSYSDGRLIQMVP